MDEASIDSAVPSSATNSDCQSNIFTSETSSNAFRDQSSQEMNLFALTPSLPSLSQAVSMLTAELLSDAGAKDENSSFVSASLVQSISTDKLNNANQTAPAEGPIFHSTPKIGRPKKPYFTYVRSFTNKDRDGGLQLEMQQFCGILIKMGLIKMASIPSYWSSDNQVPIISNTMSLNRFLFILKNLHFEDNEGSIDLNDKLWKIRPLITRLREKFLAVPGTQARSVDEQMIKFYGELLLEVGSF